jgi:hypothetical protein
LCRQDWIKTHEGGIEEEFKAHWNGLSEEEIKVGSAVHLISFFSCFPDYSISILAVETSGYGGGGYPHARSIRRGLVLIFKHWHQRKARKERKKGQGVL